MKRNMKKHYITPNLYVAQLDTHQLLATSPMGMPTADFMSNPNVSGPSSVKSFWNGGNSIWGDDWSEE